MAHPNGDATVVEHLTHVVRVDAVHHERDRRATVRRSRRTDHPHARQLLQRRQGTHRQLMLVGGHPVNAEALQVVAGSR